MTSATEVRCPDIGGFDDVPVIEVHVKPGDHVEAEDPLVTLESDKATMDVPAEFAGTVVDVLVKTGDLVRAGTTIVTAQRQSGSPAAPPPIADQHEPPAVVPTPPPPPGGWTELSLAGSHAGPSVRRMAREFHIDLAEVPATGPKGRITKDDLLAHLSGSATPAATAAAGAGIPEIPPQDFSAFGPVRSEQLPRITKLSGPFLHRSWLNVPHVTHHDEADITELDAYRKGLDTEARDAGYRVTLLAFLVKAVVSALKAFPQVNSSLSPEKDALILKEYYHLGIAVDTPGGLVVPVVRDADRKGIVELSKEFGTLSAKAREGRLAPADMAGGTFTISSLGGIGGTGFTPIVNAPEVAILGVVRAVMKPVWNGTEFTPRLMLPLSLSYDHRVVDGALAARFTRQVCHLLEDDRRLLL